MVCIYKPRFTNFQIPKVVTCGMAVAVPNIFRIRHLSKGSLLEVYFDAGRLRVRVTVRKYTEGCQTSEKRQRNEPRNKWILGHHLSYSHKIIPIPVPIPKHDIFFPFQFFPVTTISSASHPIPAHEYCVYFMCSHYFIPGSKLTFSANLFHLTLLALTWTAFSDHIGPDFFLLNSFHFIVISFP